MVARRPVPVHQQHAFPALENDAPPLVQRLLLLRGQPRLPTREELSQRGHAVILNALLESEWRVDGEECLEYAESKLQGVVARVVRVREEILGRELELVAEGTGARRRADADASYHGVQLIRAREKLTLDLRGQLPTQGSAEAPHEDENSDFILLPELRHAPRLALNIVHGALVERGHHARVSSRLSRCPPCVTEGAPMDAEQTSVT